MFSAYIVITIVYLVFNIASCTPLDDYIEDDFDINIQSHKILNTILHNNYREYHINITTLKWFDESLSSQSIWYHDLFIYTPLYRTIEEKAMLFIGGGYNDNRTYSNENLKLQIGKLAENCNCIVALLEQIPNQPITFNNDPFLRSRIEDEIVSFSWKMYFDEKVRFKNATKSTDYLPLLFPMTKAVVRTMDFLETFAFNNLKIEIDGFLLSGISKRGWTTWLTAAVDTRVVGIVPIVFDLLNQPASFHHQYRSYGGAYSFAFYDYYEVGILKYIDTPEFIESLKLVDPYYYLDRFSRVKVLLILATNDEFFLPENTKFFWNRLMTHTNGNSYLRWLPNNGHNIDERDRDSIFSSINMFLLTFVEPEEYSLPKFRWNYNQNFTHLSASLVLEEMPCPQIPVLSMYRARTTDNKRRDFRANILNGIQIVKQNVTYDLVKLGNFNLASQNEDSYRINYEAPNSLLALQSHWQANYIQIGVYLNKASCQEDEIFYLTTEMFVVPELYPIQDCYREECTADADLV